MTTINGFIQLEDGTYRRESDGQIFLNLREVYDTVSSLWAIAKQYTEQRKERLMIIKLNAKEQEQAYLEEMFPEMETFKRMEQLEKEYDLTLRQIVLLNTGEKFPGTSTRTTKEVEITPKYAVEWIIETLMENVEGFEDWDRSEFHAMLATTPKINQMFSWLTITKEGEKAIKEGVLKRTFEVPGFVAQYREVKGAIISDTKLLNGEAKGVELE